MNLKNRKLRFALFLTVVSGLFFGALWLIFSKPETAQAKTGASVGLNLVLPPATLTRDSGKTKLDFYSFALADSLRKKDDLRMDPYRKDSTQAIVAAVHAKLADLKSQPRIYVPREMEDRPLVPALRCEVAPVAPPAAVISAPDPEIVAINATLDKIAALQRPALTAADPQVTSVPEIMAYAVEVGGTSDASFFGRRAGGASSARFFGQSSQAGTAQGIRARVVGEQQEQSGSTVKLELMTAISVHGINVPAGTFLFGIAYLDGERLRVHVPSIRHGNLIFPVALQVFDLDGLEGIFVPGSLPADVMKESADQAIQSATLAGGLSLAGRAASAGLGVAKDLFSKKLRRVRVTLSNGYQVLLQDKQQNAVQ